MTDIVERLRALSYCDIPTRLEQERMEAATEIERLRAERDEACKLVADMHAAAIGYIGGPIRGVVEDVARVRSALAELVALKRLKDSITEHDGVVLAKHHATLRAYTVRKPLAWVEAFAAIDAAMASASEPTAKAARAVAAEFERDALRADAERYRQLRRDNHVSDVGDGWLFLHFDCDEKYNTMSQEERGAALDAAIDAAMANDPSK